MAMLEDDMRLSPRFGAYVEAQQAPSGEAANQPESASGKNVIDVVAPGAVLDGGLADLRRGTTGLGERWKQALGAL